MKNSKLRIAVFSLLTGVIASLAPACTGQAGDYCDTFCECERCNDDAEDLCYENTDAFLDEAEIYGCEAQAEAYITCVMNNGECVDADFDAKTDQDPPNNHCSADQQAYYTCVASASSFGSGSQTGNGAGTGPATLPGIDLPDGFSAR